MKKTGTTIQEKEIIISEYLKGETSYRKLEKKHGIDFRVIHSWVSKYQGKTMKKEKLEKVIVQPYQEEQLPTDVKQLQEELRKSRLHNKVLSSIIDIAEEQLKIDIRKKSGTKR